MPATDEQIEKFAENLSNVVINEIWDSAEKFENVNYAVATIEELTEKIGNNKGFTQGDMAKAMDKLKEKISADLTKNKLTSLGATTANAADDEARRKAGDRVVKAAEQKANALRHEASFSLAAGDNNIAPVKLTLQNSKPSKLPKFNPDPNAFVRAVPVQSAGGQRGVSVRETMAAQAAQRSAKPAIQAQEEKQGPEKVGEEKVAEKKVNEEKPAEQKQTTWQKVSANKPADQQRKMSSGGLHAK